MSSRNFKLQHFEIMTNIMFKNRQIQMFHGIFSTTLFLQIAQSAIVLAITIVSMATTSFDVSVLMGKSIYLVLLLANNALFCYLGNDVYYEVRFLYLDVRWIQTKRFPSYIFSRLNFQRKHSSVDFWTLTYQPKRYSYFSST